KLSAWEVKDTAEDLASARSRTTQHELPEGPPSATIAFAPQGAPDELVTTEVDLLSSLRPGKNYILAVELLEPTPGAKPVEYPSYMSAARRPMALVTPGDDRALAVHTHVLPDVTLVHVARLATGEPVSGARFSINGDRVEGPTTDGNGFAILPS